MLVEIPVIDKHGGIVDTASLHTDGDVAMTEIGVHRVCQSGIFLTMTIHDDTDQPAAPFVSIVMEHFQGNEVIGRRADIRVVYHKRHTLVFCLFWFGGVVAIVLRTR